MRAGRSRGNAHCDGDTAYNGIYVEHNRLLIADASGGFDAVVDVATLPELTDATNLTYYDSIGIH